MLETILQHPIVSVQNKNYQTYGGNQMLSDDKMIRRCGCGIVAAADLFIYLHRYKFAMHKVSTLEALPDNPVPLEMYNALLKDLNRHYFPLIPKFGINNVVLCAGINLFFLRRGVSLRARCVLGGGKRWELAREQLSRDIPVIFTVGQNVPFVWQKHRLPLYVRLPDGTMRPGGSVKAHFMTMTGIDDEWIRVSSWGRMFYVNQSEFEAYTKAHSANALCNIIYIR